MNAAPLSATLAAALAAHRFGLGEASLASVGNDPQGWLLAQLGAAEPQRGLGLATGVDGLKRYAEFLRLQRPGTNLGTNLGTTRGTMPNTAPGIAPVTTPGAPGGMSAEADAATSGAAAATTATATATATATSTEQQFGNHFRQIVQSDVRARLATAVHSSQPFNERLALFWANHFTVSVAKASARGIVGAFEREAIRPHIGARFDTLLKAAVHHPGMLRYLDNDSSAGPDSALVRRLARQPRDGTQRAPRVSGLNENLAREVLELHTLGVSGGGAAYGGWGGYTQRDVTEFAAVLTGWRVPLRELVLGQELPATGTPNGEPSKGSHFEASWHQPGAKTVLGKRYAEGPQALDALLTDLAMHPSTARFVAMKLARHFVADEPSPALVARLEKSFLDTGGDLPALYRSLVLAPEAWLPAPAKLKTPEEYVISTARVLALGDETFARTPDGGVNLLGQLVQAAPSPAGWPDRAEDWLGPDAVWKRVEWATRVADRVGRRVDARQLGRSGLGPLLQPSTLQQIERAADGPQALALLLLAPEFQRR